MTRWRRWRRRGRTPRPSGSGQAFEGDGPIPTAGAHPAPATDFAVHTPLTGSAPSASPPLLPAASAPVHSRLAEKEQKQLALRGAAYAGVPKEGERIRVYAKHDAVHANGRPGKYSAIYPDWDEVVKGK